MRESSIERRFTKLVKTLDGRAIKLYGRGLTDRMVVLPGKVTVWVELKAPGKKAMPHQVRFHRWLRQRGHCVILFDGTNWYQVFTYLRGLVTLAKRC